MLSDPVAAYVRAEALLPDTWGTLVHGGVALPYWIGSGADFAFSDSTEGGRVTYIVDGATGEKKPLHDPPAAAVQVGPGEVPSPDGSKVCFRREHDLWVRELATGEERQLTFDGERHRGYGHPIEVIRYTFMFEALGITPPPGVLWSPDSTRIATLRIDERDVQLMHLVRSKPPGGGRPALHSYPYAMVGDEALPLSELVCIDVGTGHIAISDCPPQNSAYFCAVTAREVWWSPDQSELLWLAYGRGARSLTLFAMDPATGATRTVHHESSELPVMPKQDVMDARYCTIRSLRNGEILWWSEASGYGHLSVLSADGSQRPLTSGSWIVHTVVAADDSYVYFTGLGREAGMDPYVRCFYRVPVAGGDVETLVADGLDHLVHGSPDATRFVDIASYLDRPATSTLRGPDGAAISVLTEADASALFAAGYLPPERFTCKGADGVTDVWGVLYRPHGLDETQKYPLIDDTYPGPQLAQGSVTFPCAGSLIYHLDAAAIAALGFAVVALDGRGTPNRGRDFQMHAWLTGDTNAGLDDRVAALRQLGERYPWIDLERVGIFGHSGGGYESARALMHHPDFYRVAVASAGGYDQLPYHAMWGEIYVGPPGSPIYAQHAAFTHVDRLEGKLLMIHGELDDNVTPYIALRLADALIEADKDFDLLILPGEEHALINRQHYWWRRRWDYFVQHLHGIAPPQHRIARRPSILAQR